MTKGHPSRGGHPLRATELIRAQENDGTKGNPRRQTIPEVEDDALSTQPMTSTRRLLAAVQGWWLSATAVVALLLATALARGSSPWLVSTGDPNGSFDAYSALLIGWPLLIATSPRLCRALRGARPWLPAPIVAWLCAQLGYRYLPLGGYDIYAKTGLYGTACLAGIAFVIAVSKAGLEAAGTIWSRRIAIGLTVVFLILAGVFVAGREGGLALGPGWGTGGAGADQTGPVCRILFTERLPISTVAAVEGDGLEPGMALDGHATVLTYWGGGAVINRLNGTATPFDLKGALTAALPGAADRVGASTYVGLQRLEFRSSAADRTLLTVAGQASMEFYRDGQKLQYLQAVNFAADLNLASATLTNITAVVPSPPPEYSMAEPVCVGTRLLTTVELGSGDSAPELRSDARGVSLYQGSQLVWHLTLSLMNTGGPDRDGGTIAWARPTANGGVIFAVQRQDWREANARGSYPGYPVSAIYYVGPR